MGVLCVRARKSHIPQITHWIDVKAVVNQELHAFGVGEDQGLLGVDQGSVGVLSLYVSE